MFKWNDVGPLGMRHDGCFFMTDSRVGEDTYSRCIQIEGKHEIWAFIQSNFVLFYLHCMHFMWKLSSEIVT